MTASSGGNLPSDTFASVPAIACAIEQRDAVDEAGHETAVGAAPSVLVLEPRKEAADRGDRAHRPVGAAGDAEQHTGERPEGGRDDPAQQDLHRARAVAKEHRFQVGSSPRGSAANPSAMKPGTDRRPSSSSSRGASRRLRLSVLDQSPVSEGSTAAQALRNTIDLARLADGSAITATGLAEHHGGPMLAGPSPEALIGPIAAATQRIRVGSGGVMLPHYSPFKVAETFSLLAGLFPGRIDLGLGRAAGTDPMTTFALQRDRRQVAPDDFPQQLAELLGYLEDRMPPDHPFARLAATLPGAPERPEPWLLGSSPQSALWAAELGLPYAFADFINPDGAESRALPRALRRARTRRRTRRARPSRYGRSAPRSERGGPAPRGERAHDLRDAAPRRADRGAAARARRAFLAAARARPLDAARVAAAARVLGAPRARCAPSCERSPRSTAPRR